MKYTVECREPFRIVRTFDKSVLGFFEEISNAYSLSFDKIFCSLVKPPRRYYLRVNLLRASREEVLRLLLDEGWEFRPDERMPEAIYLEVKGPQKIEDTGKYVVADTVAAERVMIGANLYIPGIKRIVGSKKGDYVTVITDEGKMIANGYLEVDKSSLGGRGMGVRVVRSLYRVPPVRELNAHINGLVSDQSYPSMTIPHALDPREILGPILDMTASPGGKATHLYEAVGGKETVIAVDHTNRKVERIRAEASRLSHRINVLKADSRYLHLDYPSIRPTITLVDPPCTALGVSPSLMPGRRLNDIVNLLSLQKQLLEEAVRITRPGGLIVYSTCTLTTSENEDQIGRLFRKGLVSPIESSYPLPQSKLTEHPSYRFVPGFHDYPGFFLALLRKN